MTSQWVALLLALLVALSGCTSDEPEGDSNTETGTPESNTETETEEPGPLDPLTNSAPQPSITASVMTGEVPQDVTFFLNATDADDDALSWTLDVTGDGVEETSGNSVPANYTHSFTEAGAYEVNFTVTDGIESATASITVTITDAVEEDSEPAVIQSAQITWAGGAGGCGSQYASWQFGTPLAGITHGELAVDAATYGQGYVAQMSAPGTLFIGIDWYDASGSIVADGGIAFEAEGTVTGTVPSGAAWLLAYDCGGNGAEVLYETTGKPGA